jgi:pyrroline-5-carboxylate reductase
MGKIGFIGFGSMGSIMVEALVNTGAIAADNIVINTRTPSKLKAFTARRPEVEVTSTIPELAERSDRVFICTGTGEVKNILKELARLSPDIHVITIAGTLELACIQSQFPGRISKIMPTQIAEVGEGVTLVCHNAKAMPADREFIKSAFAKIGRVKEISESQLDLAADLSGCAPAFYAAFLNNLVRAASRYGELPDQDIKEISLATFYGTAKLLLEEDVDFDAFIARVATKGGITEEGVSVLDRALPPALDAMLKATLEKRQKIKAQMRAEYGLD